MRVLVLGGAGFVGRHVVSALRGRGHDAVVATRANAGHQAKPPGPESPRIEWIALHRRCRPDDWASVIAGFDAVVNCVGILRQRWRESYAAVYVEAPTALAAACLASGKRFIHVTALGLHDNAGSGFITHKLAGERAIQAIGGESCIVRPSLLDGHDGFGSRWLRRVARWPIHPVPSDAKAQLAPLHVADLGLAVAQLCECPREALPASVELGGERRFTLVEYLANLRRALLPSSRAATVVSVPGWMVRLSAHLLDLVHLTPLSFGHVELLRRDNCPRPDDASALRRLIGRAPAPVGITAALPLAGVARSAEARRRLA